MPGHRPSEEKHLCEVLNREGLNCKSILSRGWTRCPHHTWKTAELFATELANGDVDVPVHASRHELLGLGLAVHEALADGRLDHTAVVAALTVKDEGKLP